MLFRSFHFVELKQLEELFPCLVVPVLFCAYCPLLDVYKRQGKKATEAANAIAKERNFVQSQDIGKVNKAEIKEAKMCIRDRNRALITELKKILSR